MVNPIYRFGLKVALLLPIAFAAWYYAAALLTLPLSAFLRVLLPALFPDVIDTVEQTRHVLDIVTRLPLPPQYASQVPVGQVGLLVFSVNPLIYGYGLPFLTALVLAAPGDETQKWIRFGVGYVVLLATQAWGVTFDVIKTLMFNFGPEVASSIAISGWGREGVALSYQFGYLILPAVTPLVVWISMHREFLNTLVPTMSDQDSRPRS